MLPSMPVSLIAQFLLARMEEYACVAQISDKCGSLSLTSITIFSFLLPLTFKRDIYAVCKTNIMT